MPQGQISNPLHSLKYSKSIKINIGPSNSGTIVSSTHRPTMFQSVFSVFMRNFSTGSEFVLHAVSGSKFFQIFFWIPICIFLLHFISFQVQINVSMPPSIQNRIISTPRFRIQYCIFQIRIQIFFWIQICTLFTGCIQIYIKVSMPQYPDPEPGFLYFLVPDPNVHTSRSGFRFLQNFLLDPVMHFFLTL